MFGIALLMLLCSWFIKYPDVITGRGLLHSINAPKAILVRTSGKLANLYVRERQWVAAGDVLGCIESLANAQQVIRLSIMLDSMQLALAGSRLDSLRTNIDAIFDDLGELQVAFEDFSHTHQSFVSYLENGFYLKQKAMLLSDRRYLQQLNRELQQQRHLLIEDLELADSTYKGQEMLKKDRVISPMEFRNERSKLLTKQMGLPQINASIIGNELQQQEKIKAIAELDNQVVQQRSAYMQALNSIRSHVEDWKRRFLLIAPTEGYISFLTFLQENQELREGQLIGYVRPVNSSYYAEVLISQYNFGKLDTGQEVLLKLPAYPSNEFGYLSGRIEFISSVPTDSGYLLRVELPQGIVTHYGRLLSYRTGLIVNAEIITQRLRLSQRFVNSIRGKVASQ
jgi:HlyD family secretion protein